MVSHILNLILKSFADLQCSSLHAYKRVVPLYTRSIVLSLLEPSSESSQDEGEDIISSLTTANLCQQLARLLYAAQSATLLQQAAQQLASTSNSSESLTVEDKKKLADLLQNASDDDSSTTIVCLSLGAVLDPQRDWISLLLQHSLAHFSSSSDLQLAAPIWATQHDVNIWQTTIAPALLLKVKSHPDRALDTVLGWIQGLAKHADAVALDDEWIQLLLQKHIVQGNKEENRILAQQILHVSARQSGHATYAIAKVVAQVQTSQVGVRMACYTLLQKLAYDLQQVQEASKIPSLQGVWEGLFALLAKETKPESKRYGTEALVEWMVAAKQQGVDFTPALQFFQTPLQSKHMNTSEAARLWTVLVEKVQPDILRGIVSDLWTVGSDKTWNQATETMLETASKKKAAHVDGVVAIYFALFLATGTKTSMSLHPAVTKVLTTSSSFLYSASFLDSVPSTPLIGMILPQLFALYTQWSYEQKSPSSCPKLFPSSQAAIRALVVCILNPCSTHPPDNVRTTQQHYASNALVAALERILQSEPSTVAPLVAALLDAVQQACRDFESQDISEDAPDLNTKMKGNASKDAAHRGFDCNAVRRVARLLAVDSDPIQTARVLVLMHAGSSTRNTGHQRAALIINTRSALAKLLYRAGGAFNLDELGQEIVRLASDGRYDAESSMSQTIHRSACSLLVSLAVIASNDPTDNDKEEPYHAVHKLCVEIISPKLAAKLKESLERVESLSADDMEIYLTPLGTLCEQREERDENTNKKTGKRLTEDDEWELQTKKELAKKKKDAVNGLTEERRKKIQDQDVERERIKCLLNGDFVFTLESIQLLSSSDIEVGNSCLATFADPVLRSAVSVCPAVSALRNVRVACYDTLMTLANCVYEIDEKHASAMVHALLISCRRPTSTDGTATGPIQVSALPSPCAPAAVCVYEIDQFGDCLSGPSFNFLFPVLQACLMGPRTAIGCDKALAVLERHTQVLYGDGKDVIVLSRRKDMAISVLELLKHDRCQTFQNPTAFETLVACYNADLSTSPLTTGELAPLLDERGSLGKQSCRLGSMMALRHIAESHPKLAKSDPLVENRIWYNCFADDEEIKKAARMAWATFGGNLEEESPHPPSPLYAPILIPLLNHHDESIAKAAAEAFAHALAAYPKSVGRNVEMLCKNYLDAFPYVCAESNTESVAAPKPAIAAPKPKPVVATKLKVAPKPSALSIAGIGKPKVAVKKKSALNSALLKPRAERTLDQAELENQFKPASTKLKIQEEKDSPEKVSIRLGVLGALSAITRLPFHFEMDEFTLKLLTSFLMAFGLADSDETVKNAARDTLRDIVASNGGSEEAIAFLLPHLEEVLKTGSTNGAMLSSLSTDKIPKDVSSSDRRKEGAVVALGSVALHLKGPENDTKIDSTVDMLIGALNTPSEEVQTSVADALTKLMKKGNTQDRIEDLLNDLLRTCLNGSSLASRRGGAYGLSALVKGTGITTLKKFDIVKRLEEACSSGSSSEKEGSLFAIELLSSRLGLLFEPYVIVLLPSLLRSFSDSNDHVRKAASNTVGVIMSKLSAHGVKLVMPAVLTAFNDPAWRTKQASIHMLGAMSHLAPKQLASALPKIVPKLTEAFSDTHPKVKTSAQEALDEIKTVVKNPEISHISSTLLKALTDPADYTTKALETLIETEFLHAIDAPSLALIVPILHRGLRDRGATTKRYAGLIAGNISTMINDAKDLVPYLPTLLPDLQTALLDPIPDVRSTSGKALGSLTRSLGEQIILEIRPWLISKLRDPSCSSAERSGAAQGLTEVLIASGSNVVDETIINEILPLRNHPEASTREGVLWMLSFLPPALGQGFSPYIGMSLPALVGGLSDDSEPVREVALRAGRVLIRSHGKVHVDKILPSLEEGLVNDDHRIRIASLTLLGDLLSMLGGTTMVKGDGDTQDDIRKAERAQAQIALALGPDTRRRVLSELYIARSDPVHMVRQIALQVWKTVVSVTARSLRDILPALVSKIISNLASGHPERTVVAGRSLGDVVSKLGDSVLPQIMPVLRNTLRDGDENTKCGVCVGLSEVIQCSTKEQILRFIEIIVKVVQDALSDESPRVQKMAASSFQSLYVVVGSRAFDEVVPSLMVALENNEADEDSRSRALNGLTGILSVRSKELLPYLIPRLIRRPITANHARALGGIAAVTGGTIYTSFSQIIPPLLTEMAELEDGDERKNALIDCVSSICANVDSAGVNLLVSEIAGKTSSDKPSLRRESCRMLEITISERKYIFVAGSADLRRG